jgi:cobalt-precorrin 5A hydrolase
LYFSKIKVIGNSSVAEKIRDFLSQLGYYVVDDDEEVRVVVGSLSRGLKYINNKPVIVVSPSGNYVIPLHKEGKVSFLASIIADLMDSTLVLTSKFAEMGLYSVQEFSWINGLYWKKYEKVKEVNKKLLEKGRVSVYVDDHVKRYYVPKEGGYVISEYPCDADIIIGGDGSCSALYLYPYKVVVGLKYISPMPLEVILYSIKLTLKSIYLNENRLDVIVSSIGDRRLLELAKLFNAEVVKVSGDTCESLLLQYGGKIILKGVKRAFGLETCLGVAQVEGL